MNRAEVIAELKAEAEALDADMRVSRAECDRYKARLEECNKIHGDHQERWHWLHTAIEGLEKSGR